MPLKCSVRWALVSHCFSQTIFASTAAICSKTQFNRIVEKMQNPMSVQILERPIRTLKVAQVPMQRIAKLAIARAESALERPLWKLSNASLSRSIAKWSRWQLTIIAGRTWQWPLWKNSLKSSSQVWKRNRRFTRSWLARCTSTLAFPWSLITRIRRRRSPSSSVASHEQYLNCAQAENAMIKWKKIS